VSKRSAQRTRGRARWERRREAKRKARLAAAFPPSGRLGIVEPTIVGESRVLFHLTRDQHNAMARAGMFYRPPSLRGKRRRTRRYRERQL
jgi:hypothetical protein